MHLITGAIIAALLGNKKERTSPLLNIRGPINTTHLLPGRVRFHIPSLKQNDIQIAKLREQLPQIEGITSVQANEITGSVLIRFDTTKLKAELLAAALIRMLGLESELEKSPIPTIPRELREMGKSLNRAVYDKTGGLIDVWSAIPMLLLITAGRKIIAEGQLGTPTAMTLLWWGYNSLFQEKRQSD